jgi:hypothetical protein
MLRDENEKINPIKKSIRKKQITIKITRNKFDIKIKHQGMKLKKIKFDTVKRMGMKKN